jgi:hypothetical protein
MALCPFAEQHPVGNHSGPLAQNIGLVLHVQAGGGSLRDYFNNPGVEASSHFWAAKDGRLEQYVDTALEAWAQEDGNASYCSVETEGQPTEALTDAQVAALARLYAWGHQVHGWPFVLADVPGQAGFAWHGMGGAAWGGHTGCPGDLRKAQRPDILSRASGAAPASEEDDMPTFAVGEIPNDGKAHTIPVPPPHGGAAGWGDVWLSLASSGKAQTARVAVFMGPSAPGGAGVWGFGQTALDVAVPSDRRAAVRLAPGAEKVEVTCSAAPVGWMLEVTKG